MSCAVADSEDKTPKNRLATVCNHHTLTVSISEWNYCNQTLHSMLCCVIVNIQKTTTSINAHSQFYSSLIHAHIFNITNIINGTFTISHMSILLVMYTCANKFVVFWKITIEFPFDVRFKALVKKILHLTVKTISRKKANSQMAAFWLVYIISECTQLEK